MQAKDQLRPTWRPSAGSPHRKCTPSAYSTSPRESVSRNFQSPYGSLQISFACHPGGGGLLSAYLSDNLNCSFYSDGKSPPPPGGRWCVSTKRGASFPSPARAVVWFSHGRKPGCKDFIQTGGEATHLPPPFSPGTLPHPGHQRPLPQRTKEVIFITPFRNTSDENVEESFYVKFELQVEYE